MAEMNENAITKAFSGAMGLVEFFSSIPKSCKDDVVDGILDFIEAKATEKNNTMLLTICSVARKIVNVPDEDEETDQTNPM